MDTFQGSSSVVDGDDNAFYEELARQILMLTDEDDDDKAVYSNGVAELRRIPMVYGGVESRPVARNMNYYSWSETGMQPVPSWMESLWSNGGGGTGVFIPSGAAAAGRRKRSGRRRYNNNNAMKSNDKGRVYSAVGQKLHG
ncbi:hypothetical protein L1987_79225 [Smallanthus sonchifolius]|uniref:Uncharacterized protein n=1 Tax=Smallanthus sonchifolius TaxID=185202 RepID=A0ACB8ZEU2_9ASTR|nr:hypothetical protein L1987_79225 [Smallanthus sonchifolius]